MMLSFFFLLLGGVVAEQDGCTMIGTGKNVMADGSLITTHNNDCEECDIRITHVPARDWPKGSKRAVYDCRAAYPRYVETKDNNPHGPDYLIDDVDTSIYDWKIREPMGYIDQVEHTYAYTLGTYALQNEKQVSIGESTCGAKIFAKPVAAGGKALLHMNMLTELGLERCDTARCAVQTMGDLSMQYGFFGEASTGDEHTAKSEAGEALMVADPTEAWVFHILPDDTGTQAVWVAQRIPDDELAVCANSFVIGEIDVSDTDNFLASDNIFEVAKRNDFWKEGEPFLFHRVYGMGYAEQGHMSTRRIWRVFTMAAPSLPISPYTDEWATFGYGKDGTEAYPFSVKPDKKLILQDIMRMNRDQYEGTEFDLTQGLDAGPFGDPMRYSPTGHLTDPENGIVRSDINASSFNLGTGRAISLWRTAYSSITQSRPGLPDEIGAVTWVAQYAPHHSSFVPVYANAEKTPSSINTGTQYKLDKDANYWVHSATSNYISKWYKYTLNDVNTLQAQLEEEVFLKQHEAENKALEVYERRRLAHHHDDTDDTSAVTSGEEKEVEEEAESVASILGEFHEWAGTHIRDSWWDFFYLMLGNYRDMIRIVDPHVDDYKNARKGMTLPRWYVEQMGFWGYLGAKAPSREYAQPVYPINIPTLGSLAEYDEKFPLRMNQVMNSVDTPSPYTGPPSSKSKRTSAPTDDAADLDPVASSIGYDVGVFLVGSLFGALVMFVLSRNSRTAAGYNSIN